MAVRYRSIWGIKSTKAGNSTRIAKVWRRQGGGAERKSRKKVSFAASLSSRVFKTFYQTKFRRARNVRATPFEEHPCHWLIARAKNHARRTHAHNAAKSFSCRTTTSNVRSNHVRTWRPVAQVIDGDLKHSAIIRICFC